MHWSVASVTHLGMFMWAINVHTYLYIIQVHIVRVCVVSFPDWSPPFQLAEMGLGMKLVCVLVQVFGCNNLVVIHKTSSTVPACTGFKRQQVQLKQWCVELRDTDVWDLVLGREAISQFEESGCEPFGSSNVFVCVHVSMRVRVFRLYDMHGIWYSVNCTVCTIMFMQYIYCTVVGLKGSWVESQHEDGKKKKERRHPPFFLSLCHFKGFWTVIAQVVFD